MKIIKRFFCAVLVAVLAVTSALSAGAQNLSESARQAVEKTANLSAHSQRVAVTMYDSVKILTGFVPGESYADAVAEFSCGDKMIFMDLNGKVVSSVKDKLYTGAVVCVADGDRVTDVGIFAVFGDTDGNGKCTAADARLILRHAAGLEPLAVLAAAAGDCNADGKVTAADARTALRAAAGLEPMGNPIGAVPSAGEPVAIFAYYTGSDPAVGEKINLNSVRVVAAYNDAKSAVIESGFTVEPASLTADKPGKMTFTVTWQGLSSSMTVNFTARKAESFYPDSKVPDYTSFAGVQPSQVRHEISYITYIYPANRNLTDYVSFEAYMNYLVSCGFVLTGKNIGSGQIVAVFEKKEDQATAALIYDFTGRQIYVAVKQGNAA